MDTSSVQRMEAGSSRTRWQAARRRWPQGASYAVGRVQGGHGSSMPWQRLSGQPCSQTAGWAQGWSQRTWSWEILWHTMRHLCPQRSSVSLQGCRQPP
jgi:hypothetical protein